MCKLSRSYELQELLYEVVHAYNNLSTGMEFELNIVWTKNPWTLCVDNSLEVMCVVRVPLMCVASGGVDCCILVLKS